MREDQKQARIRGKEVVRLKDAKRWTLQEIGDYFEISRARAHQVYWEQKERDGQVNAKRAKQDED